MSFNSFLQVRWGLPAILTGQRTAPGATLKVAPVPKTPRRRTSEPESERGLSQAAAAALADQSGRQPARFGICPRATGRGKPRLEFLRGRRSVRETAVRGGRLL